MAESLREVVEGSFDKVIEPEAPAEPQAPAEAPVEAEPQGERARDPDTGRFLEKTKEPEVAAKPKEAKAPTPTPQAQGAQSLAAAPQVSAPKVPRPSTWKKDHWEDFDKLAQSNPALAAYINQREGEYAKGVSTYKQEWETAKPLIDAMAPFMPLLQQHKIEPAQWIGNLGKAHQILAMGTPEQKKAAFIKLAGDYQVQLGDLFVQGQDGRIYFNNQFQQTAAQQQQPTPPVDVRAQVSELLAEERANQEVAAMEANTEKYPHLGEVRMTMAGLLRAGVVQTPDEAYQTALRTPQHFQLYEAQQQQQRQAEEKEKAEAARRAAEAARRKVASPKSGTPTGALPGGDNKGLRSAIESAFDSKVGGRV